MTTDSAQRQHSDGNGHHTADRGPAEETPREALADAMTRIGELKAYFAQYAAARADGIKLSIRKMVLLAIMGVLGLLVGGAVLITAAVIIVTGLAQLIGHLLGDRLWAGNLIVGVLVLGLVGLAVWLVVRKVTHASHNATVNRYERRLKQQRVTLDGHDARQRSAEYEAEQC